MSESELMAALKTNNYEVIEKLLNAGVDALYIDEDDESIDSIMYAIIYCPIKVLELLITHSDRKNKTHGEYFDFIACLQDGLRYCKIHSYQEHYDVIYEYMKQKCPLELN